MDVLSDTKSGRTDDAANSSASFRVPKLNATELRIIRGIARGLHSKEIAVELERSVGTIELYIRTLYSKFESKSRAHLVARAFCCGALRPSDISE